MAATGLVELAKRHPSVMLATAGEWSRDDDANIRRAASEGLRGLVHKDPEGVRQILEVLREDPEPYVKKSVANVLRNATRTYPDFVVRLCTEWANSSNPHTQWIVRNGLGKMKVTRPSDATRIVALLHHKSPND
ncbi:MAG TPA: DNA alkylation repair protein [Gemmatimonadaceae bacterium]|nr:DNA alkylation repair protein [Gemmatimonadaceae bacterium]